MKLAKTVFACVLLLGCTGYLSLHAQKKAAPATEKKETLSTNPFDKIQKELTALSKEKPTSFSHRRKLANRMEYLQKRLKSQQERIIAPLEKKKRHLAGRLAVTTQPGKKMTIQKQISAIEKEILLTQNTADMEKYTAMASAKPEEPIAEKAKKSKKTKKGKKSKK